MKQKEQTAQRAPGHRAYAFLVRAMAVGVAALAVACIVSIARPILFQRTVAAREAKVKNALLRIRQAEEAYRTRHGAYTDDWDRLTAATGLPRDCRYIPHSDGQVFTLRISNDVAVSGEVLPLMECEAPFHTYLHDLNAREVEQLTHAEERLGHFAGLKFGDITKQNNNAINRP